MITPNNSTPYQDINEVLDSLTRGIERILGEKLVGLYLTGSLSYGDFNPASSDIDLVAVVRTPLTPGEIRLIADLHTSEGQKFPRWAKRVECSYLPIALLDHILPPQAPRPYTGEGIFYPEAGYGNEWIINLYLQYEHGITLVGTEFKLLTAPIAIGEVQKACIRDLFREWEPKLKTPEWLDNPHYQSYLVLNLCRIVYTVLRKATGSKTVSAAWMKSQYGEWSALIEAAEGWQYGEA
ncbi:MAG: aminoglycoside adenylyltransferase domain-containing protein, partial [Chloroflexota bacterium]